MDSAARMFAACSGCKGSRKGTHATIQLFLRKVYLRKKKKSAVEVLRNSRESHETPKRPSTAALHDLTGVTLFASENSAR